MECKYAVDPWTAQVWTAQVYLHAEFFSISIPSALSIPEFCIRGFSQPQIENSISDPWLGIHRCRGVTVCVVVRHFIWGTWASVEFDAWAGPGTNPRPVPRNSTVWGGVKSYNADFRLHRVSTLNPHIVQRSIVFFKMIPYLVG